MGTRDRDVLRDNSESKKVVVFGVFVMQRCQSHVNAMVSEIVPWIIVVSHICIDNWVCVHRTFPSDESANGYVSDVCGNPEALNKVTMMCQSCIE
jgi:hypothetical protein